MTDRRRPSNQSSAPFYHLPSFSSLSGNTGYGENINQEPRPPSHDTPPDESTQALRQQIMNRDQIIANLRAEQAHLHSAFEQLDAKSKVMDHEVNSLTEERAELRKQISTLAVLVERLTRDKEQLQNQSQADAAQWRQIMSMSSKLQMQSVEETRRFNVDRENWARERERLEQRIQSLQGDTPLARTETSDSTEISPSASLRQGFQNLAMMSEDQLRYEVASLRDRCLDLENILSSMIKETPSIERMADSLRRAKNRVNMSDNDPADNERKRQRA